MNKEQVSAVVIVVALVAGYVGYMVGVSSKGGVSNSNSDSALQAKLDEVKKMFPPMPDSNFVYGQVKSVNGNVITLSTPPSNPFDESPATRQITVDSSTKIVKNENKSSEIIQGEQEAYQKKMSAWKPGSTDTPPTPPMPFIEKKVSVSEIKEGDQLSVEAATKIRMQEKFTAIKIVVQTSMAPIPPSTATANSTPPPASPVLPPATTTPPPALPPAPPAQ